MSALQQASRRSTRRSSPRKSGFSYVGYYDSPALEPDVWITVANVVQATRRITVGTEVLIPHLRHPMVQASAIATIEQLAPGRLYVGVGTGFTGRMAMGGRPLTWDYMRRFLTQVKALLVGEQVEIDGAVTRMLHPPGFAPTRPISVPFLVAANGPKGVGVAREIGDGLIYGGAVDHVPAGFAILQMGAGGIVLEDDETTSSPRCWLRRGSLSLSSITLPTRDSATDQPRSIKCPTAQTGARSSNATRARSAT